MSSAPRRARRRAPGNRPSSARHATPTRGGPSTPHGIHLIRDRRVVDGMVTSAGLDSGDLVVEFGAGTGILTEALATTGARVLAVERLPRFVRALERRFADVANVRVVHGDARDVMLPRRRYVVVANLPYSVSTAVLRRLLSPRRTPVDRIDLLVEWGFARRVTDPIPRDRETASWQCRFDLEIVRRVSPTAFNPAPSVASAHLRIRRRHHT